MSAYQGLAPVPAAVAPRYVERSDPYDPNYTVAEPVRRRRSRPRVRAESMHTPVRCEVCERLYDAAQHDACPRQHPDPNAPTLETIRDLLDRSDKAVERALVVLYARQTADEQATGTTREHNGQGFNGTDAELLSSFAQQIERGRSLTERQLFYARKKVRKYARQLLEEALAKRATKSTLTLKA